MDPVTLTFAAVVYLLKIGANLSEADATDLLNQRLAKGGHITADELKGMLSETDASVADLLGESNAVSPDPRNGASE